MTEKRRSVVGNVFRGSAGNLIEWYDWYTYAAFAVYFSAEFFPGRSATARLMDTAGVFAVGFLVRPLGGWLLGRYADRRGRRDALTLSMTLMAAGSLVVALTPGHASIGVFAPVLLLLARVLQGLSLGGEYGATSTYLAETATPGRRGFYASFLPVTVAGGQLTALGVQIVLQSLLSQQQMHAWGWRVAFALGSCGALAALWLRRTMDEPERPAHDGEGTLRELLRYRREVLTVAGLTLGGTVVFYTFTTYMQKYMVNTTGLPKTTVTWINFTALLLFALVQPLAGALSDRIGRRPLLLSFGVGSTLLTVPLLTALGSAGAGEAFVLMLAGLLLVTGYTSVKAVVKTELFPAHIRALGVGLPFAVTVAVFGGTVEYVALWLKDAGHESWFFGYVAACALVSTLVYVRMPESLRHSRLEEAIPPQGRRRPAGPARWPAARSGSRTRD